MDLTRRKGHKHFSTPNCPVDVTLAGGDTADSETDCDDRENRQDCDLTLESKSDTSSPRKSFQPLLVVVMAAALMLGAAVLFSLIGRLSTYPVDETGLKLYLFKCIIVA